MTASQAAHGGGIAKAGGDRKPKRDSETRSESTDVPHAYGCFAAVAVAHDEDLQQDVRH